MSATPLMTDYFFLTQNDVRKTVDTTLRLTQRVRNAVTAVREKKTSRHLLSVACITAILQARDEKLLHNQVQLTQIYSSTNLSRFVKLKKLQDIVRKADDGELDARNVHVVSTTTLVTSRNRRRREHTQELPLPPNDPIPPPSLKPSVVTIAVKTPRINDKPAISDSDEKEGQLQCVLQQKWVCDITFLGLAHLWTSLLGPSLSKPQASRMSV